MKKLIHFLKVWDGIWSIPLALLIFLGSGYAVVSIFGPEAGAMLPVYLQRLFYASLALVVCSFCALFGMYMNFRGLFHFYLDDSCADLPNDPKFKMKLTLFVYFAYCILFTIFVIFV